MEAREINTKFASRAILPFEVLGVTRCLHNHCVTADGVECIVTVEHTSWVHDDGMRRLLEREFRELYGMPFKVAEDVWIKRLGIEKIEYWDEITMQKLAKSDKNG